MIIPSHFRSLIESDLHGSWTDHLFKWTDLSLFALLGAIAHFYQEILYCKYSSKQIGCKRLGSILAGGISHTQLCRSSHTKPPATKATDSITAAQLLITWTTLSFLKYVSFLIYLLRSQLNTSFGHLRAQFKCLRPSMGAIRWMQVHFIINIGRKS